MTAWAGKQDSIGRHVHLASQIYSDADPAADNGFATDAEVAAAVSGGSGGAWHGPLSLDVADLIDIDGGKGWDITSLSGIAAGDVVSKALLAVDADLPEGDDAHFNKVSVYLGVPGGASNSLTNPEAGEPASGVATDYLHGSMVSPKPLVFFNPTPYYEWAGVAAEGDSLWVGLSSFGAWAVSGSLRVWVEIIKPN